jgi:transposase
MKKEGVNLPENAAELQSTVLELNKKLEDLKERERQYELENNLLREQIKALTHRLYGRKSEKYHLDSDEEQRTLFDELEEQEEVEEEESEAIEIKPHKRKKPGRKPLPADLPREDVIHDLEPEEKMCGCGCEMVRMGEEVSEKLEMTPATFTVKRHIRYKYTCKNCEGLEDKGGAVKIAPVPVQLIPKSLCTPSLLANIVIGKFADSLPLYRQENQFKRYGIDLPRSTMSNWLLKVYLMCQPLIELLRLELLSGPLIGADETTMQVLKENGRSPTSTSYMWCFRGGPPGRPVVLYKYAPSRSGEVAAGMLKGYQGYVQTDAFAGYNFLDDIPGITHVGCWSHTRRNFIDVITLVGKKKISGKADKALSLIAKLYKVEKEAREAELTAEELHEKRQLESKSVVLEFEAFVKENCPRVLPKSALGKALQYSVKQMPRLKVFLESGLIPLDNNLVENAIRPYAVGRKNWLFSYHADGAAASALYYSLTETAKANGLEPYSYFLYLFKNLPFAATQEDYKKLLPQYLDREKLIQK